MSKYYELFTKKKQEYLDIQEKARNERDIDKRNEYISQLNKININLNAIEVIFENNRIDKHLMDHLDPKTKAELMEEALKEED